MTITYRRAVKGDAATLAQYLITELKKQPDLLAEVPPLDKLTNSFNQMLPEAAGGTVPRRRHHKPDPSTVCQLGTEGGAIVALALGTLGFERDDALNRDVKFVLCDLIIVSGWTTQRERLERLAELVKWCLDDDITNMGVERVKTGSLKSACMGANWMASTVKWEGTASSDGSVKEFSGSAADMRGRL